MAYAKRYAGGFVDKPTLTTPIDSTFLNAVEAALLALYDAAPGAANMVPVWTPGGTHYVPQLLTNASIDPAAAIAKSKLANLAIADADVAGGAAISRSKLNFGAGLVDADIAAAAAIVASKLAGYPTDGNKVLAGDGTWVNRTALKKVTATTISNSVAQTDVLGGLVIPAGAMSATGMTRIRIWGTSSNATGAAQNAVRFQLYLGGLGGTLMWDAQTSGATTMGNGGGAIPWDWDIVLYNANATNSQITYGRMQFHHLTSNLTAWLPSTGAGLTIAALENSGGHAFTHTEIRGVAARDTTVAQTLSLGVILPVASASFVLTCDGALLEVLG